MTYQRESAVQGFINLNKPLGLTSHDCVAKARRLLRQKRIGHAGTLDPAASGVLPIAVGRTTRLIQYLATDKSYRAIVRFGLTTTTDDLEGDIITSQPVADLTLATVEQLLPQFIGTIQQIPPRYSAIQIQGQRLYDLARAGKSIEVPVRTVQIDAINIIEWRSGEYPELELTIDCGVGTYIRAIARDIGACVGTGATLAGLIRTRSSGFELADSLTLEQLSHQVEQEQFTLIPPEQAIAHLPAIELTPPEAKGWLLGQKQIIQNHSMLPAETIVRVIDPANRFLGIGQLKHHEQGILLRPKLVFSEP